MSNGCPLFPRIKKLLPRSTARTQANYGEMLNSLSNRPADATATGYGARDPPHPTPHVRTPATQRENSLDLL